MERFTTDKRRNVCSKCQAPLATGEGVVLSMSVQQRNIKGGRGKGLGSASRTLCADCAAEKFPAMREVLDR